MLHILGAEGGGRLRAVQMMFVDIFQGWSMVADNERFSNDVCWYVSDEPRLLMIQESEVETHREAISGSQLEPSQP